MKMEDSFLGSQRLSKQHEVFEGPWLETSPGVLVFSKPKRNYHAPTFITSAESKEYVQLIKDFFYRYGK